MTHRTVLPHKPDSSRTHPSASFAHTRPVGPRLPAGTSQTPTNRTDISVQTSVLTIMPGRRRKDAIPDTSAADAEADALSCEVNVLAGLRSELASNWGMTSAENMADVSDPLPVLDGNGLLNLDAMLEEPYGTWELKSNGLGDEVAPATRLLDSSSLFNYDEECDFTSGQAKRTASYRQLADLLETPSPMGSPEHYSSWALSDGSSGRGSPSSVDFSINTTMFNAPEMSDSLFDSDDFNPLISDMQSLKPLADIALSGVLGLEATAPSLNFSGSASPDRKRRRMGGPQVSEAFLLNLFSHLGFSHENPLYPCFPSSS